MCATPQLSRATFTGCVRPLIFTSPAMGETAFCARAARLEPDWPSTDAERISRTSRNFISPGIIWRGSMDHKRAIDFFCSSALLLFFFWAGGAGTAVTDTTRLKSRYASFIDNRFEP